jgi:predicted Zn-dependent protease
MVQPDGKAMLILTLAQGESLEAAAQKMVQDFNLKVVESKKENVNGLPALAFVADVQPQQQQQQQQQQQIRVLSYLIQYGGNIYNLMGVAGLNDFNNYGQTFLATMTNFRELIDPQKLNRQPDRIKIKQVPQNGTLAQALRNLQVKDDKITELALLNGMDPDENVNKGMLIKVIEK